MKYEKQLEAKKLRAEGKSIKSIAQQLGVAKSSVSVWVRDIILTEEQKQKLIEHKNYNFKPDNSKKQKNYFLDKRKSFQDIGREKARENNLLFCMGCMLFWAEGTKAKNSIIFTNSDVNMMKLFVKFLKECLNIKNEQINILINCFLNNHSDIDNVHNFWIKELNIEGANIYKPTIKITKEPVDNYGVCKIAIHSTELAQQLYGAIQEFGGFDNNLGLQNKRSMKKNN